MTKKNLVAIETRIPRIPEEKKRPNRRLLLIITFFFLAIFFVLFFEFYIGRISYIRVEGNELLTDKEIALLSGVTEKDSFLALSTNQIMNNVRSHSEVKDVRVEKKFPNGVAIYVTEYTVVGYLVDKGTMTPVLETGRILTDRAVTHTPVQSTMLHGFSQDDNLQELVAELAKMSPSIRNSLSEIHNEASETKRQLITIYTNEGFQVIVPLRNFAKKMLVYPTVIRNLADKGVIHIEGDGVVFTPFHKINN